MAAILTPAAAYISLSADYKTITVIKNNIVLPTDLGVHPFSVTINSVEYAGNSVATKVLNFNVDITCTINSFTTNSKAAD